MPIEYQAYDDVEGESSAAGGANDMIQSSSQTFAGIDL